jgi:hypothetical protein
MGSQFVIKNPNAQSSCGCGSSFSVWIQTIILYTQNKKANGIALATPIVLYESTRIHSWKKKET